jgi:hypothetical protein
MTIFARLAIAVGRCLKAMFTVALADVPIVVSLRSLRATMKTDDEEDLISRVRLECTNELGAITILGDVSQKDMVKIIAIIVGEKEIEQGEMH